jgi:hypothetical protein
MGTTGRSTTPCAESRTEESRIHPTAPSAARSRNRRQRRSSSYFASSQYPGLVSGQGRAARRTSGEEPAPEMRRSPLFCRPLKRAANLGMLDFPRLEAGGYDLRPASLAQTVSRGLDSFPGNRLRSAFPKLVSLHLSGGDLGISSMNRIVLGHSAVPAKSASAENPPAAIRSPA